MAVALSWWLWQSRCRGGCGSRGVVVVVAVALSWWDSTARRPSVSTEAAEEAD